MTYLLDTHKGKYFVEANSFVEAITKSNFSDNEIISITSIVEYNNCLAQCIANAQKPLSH